MQTFRMACYTERHVTACKLNFTDVAAVLVTPLLSVFSAATAVKTADTAAIADGSAVKTVLTVLYLLL